MGIKEGVWKWGSEERERVMGGKGGSVEVGK